MREIKFRGWSKDLKEMLWGGFVINVDGEVGTLTNERNWDLELMQYINHKDKNRRDIFEGDLLRHPDFPRVIEVKDLLTAYHYEEQGVNFLFAEIIGNVWENPELLKKQKT